MVFRSIAIICLAVFAFACGKQKPRGRYISENDTAFSKDIRDVSARINKDPGNAELYYLRGNAFFYQEKYKDANLDLTTALEMDSLKPTWHFRLAESLLKLDTADSRQARQHLETALRLQPDFPDASLLAAKLMIARQEYSKAENILKKLTQHADMADKAWVLMGVSKKEQKDTQLALQYFDQAVQLNPKNTDAALQVALIHAADNDPKTLLYFDKVLAGDEYNDEAWYGKGLYHYQHGQYKDALACFDKTSTLNPAHRLSRYNAAMIYALFEDWEKALEWCNRALDLDPNYANALALRGFVNEKTGRKKAATDDYRAALKSDPKNTPAREGLKALGVNP